MLYKIFRTKGWASIERLIYFIQHNNDPHQVHHTEIEAKNAKLAILSYVRKDIFELEPVESLSRYPKEVVIQCPDGELKRYNVTLEYVPSFDLEEKPVLEPKS